MSSIFEELLLRGLFVVFPYDVNAAFGKVFFVLRFLGGLDSSLALFLESA